MILSPLEGAAEMIQRWQPKPSPTWVTCVTSLNRPELVPNFAARLAQELELPFIAAVKKIHSTSPQKEMNNSHQQAHNLENAFTLDKGRGRNLRRMEKLIVLFTTEHQIDQNH
jgi:ATP-dependent DNA helicase RecQ